MSFANLSREQQDKAARARLARFLVHSSGTVAPEHQPLIADEVAKALHGGIQMADPSFEATRVIR
jgi:hypothetical protein